ncbi:hypothetical protein KR222_007360 [Zaprionus bogoriensis]|nr:hypothetical protein KR222_007360 [Zaprionus bogoriensis]
MDSNISLEQHDAFYRKALAAQEQSHFIVPKSLKCVEEMQQRCRICGCLDDGTFVDLDATQEFEFDSSISNYRVLFQRTSLQFQFHTMPDLPSRLCARCGYKAKIFYLLTRQFVLGQYAMRATITEWYHNKYNIEPPEQLEDQRRLKRQLAMAETTPPPLPALIPASPPASVVVLEAKRKEKPEKKLPASGVGQHPGELKRSVSADNRLDAGVSTPKGGRRSGPASPEVTGQRKNLEICQMARSRVNLGFSTKVRSPLKKTTQSQPQVPQPKQTGQGQTGRGQTNRLGTIGAQNRDRLTCKSADRRECFVTPRVVKGGGARDDNSLTKAPTNRKYSQQLAAADIPLKPEVPPSKAQVQQTLQERRSQWR